MTVKELKEKLSEMPEESPILFGIVTPDEYIPCEFEKMEYDYVRVVDVYFTSKDITRNMEELNELREEADLNTVSIELVPDFKVE